MELECPVAQKKSRHTHRHTLVLTTVSEQGTRQWHCNGIARVHARGVAGRYSMATTHNPDSSLDRPLLGLDGAVKPYIYISWYTGTEFPFLSFLFLLYAYVATNELPKTRTYGTHPVLAKDRNEEGSHLGISEFGKLVASSKPLDDASQHFGLQHLAHCVGVRCCQQLRQLGHLCTTNVTHHTTRTPTRWSGFYKLSQRKHQNQIDANSNVQCTNEQMANAQMHKCTNAQMLKCPNAQMHQYCW